MSHSFCGPAVRRPVFGLLDPFQFCAIAAPNLAAALFDSPARLADLAVAQEERVPQHVHPPLAGPAQSMISAMVTAPAAASLIFLAVT